MAFSRMAKAKAPAPSPAEDADAAAWQQQLQKEQEERSREDARAEAMAQVKAQAAEKKRIEEMEARQRTINEAKRSAAAEDDRWKEAHSVYSANLADSRREQQQLDEETARQQRIERSKSEAARRATAGTGAAFGAAPGGFGASGGAAASGASRTAGFSWKKQSPPGGYGARAQGGHPSGDLPSHDDCELAISAMISRTMQGMKEGLRQLGLPDYPLKFIPGRELQLCGHDVREVINEMIHAWMTDEKDEFYNVLLRIKSIVANPILSEEDMGLIEHQENWEQAGGGYVQKGTNIGPAAKPKVSKPPADDSDDEVIDLSSQAAQPKKPEPVRTHNFAKGSVDLGDGEDHYEMLGVQPTATLQEIRLKFRQLVITEHPEKGGDPKKFAKLNKAYGVLSDQEKRRQYDEQRSG